MDGSYSSGTYSTTWSTGFFGGCSSLTEIELPSSIIKVGNGCFSDCSNLSKLTINAENVPETGYSVFEGTLYKSVGSLFVPENSAALYKAAEQWKDWKNISEGKGYKLTYLVDGLEYKDREGFVIFVSVLSIVSGFCGFYYEIELVANEGLGKDTLPTMDREN